MGDMVVADVKERPILFSGEMVRAILDGRKTQTRRVVKPQPEAGLRFVVERPAVGGSVAHFGYVDVGGVHHKELTVTCRQGQPGDRLWVRETAYIAPPNFGRDSDANLTDDQGRGRVVSWAASSEAPEAAGWYGIKKTPSMFMPRWASRLTLEVVSVRVERVQEITEADAIAEGMIKYQSTAREDMARWMFMQTWDSINGESAPWASNPWVWVVEFKRVAA